MGQPLSLAAARRLKRLAPQAPHQVHMASHIYVHTGAFAAIESINDDIFPLLDAYRAETPFLVAGGLTPSTVGAAIKAVKHSPSFVGVDVSSGVESVAGVKDRGLVASFIKAAKSAF